MTALNMNAMVSYSATDDGIYAGVGTGASSIDWDYWKWHQPIVREYYPLPVYYGTTRYEDTYKKAFSIAKLLLKKKLLVSRRLKDFIGLVEEIAKEL